VLLHTSRSPRAATVWLLVITLLCSLLPLAVQRTDAAEASAPFTLSKSEFVAGYPTTTITFRGSDAFLLRPDTKVTLYDANGVQKQVIQNVNVTSNKELTFVLQPGLHEGTYLLLVQSHQTVKAQLRIITTYDPTDIRVTPGVDRDIRIDWIDPNAPEVRDIYIQYAPMERRDNWQEPIIVPLGRGTTTIKGLDHERKYRFQVFTRKAGSNFGTIFTLDNGGLGYQAIDRTPPGDLTNVAVTAVNNGFRINWRDPLGPDNLVEQDLRMITVQIAEHGTTNWSDGYVVSKGIQTTLIEPLNTSKRYDLRFTKTDIYGNWSYQIDTHNGYGYTFDTTSPLEVTNLQVVGQSDTNAYITWYDPTSENNPDFHHVNLYMRTAINDWKAVGRVNKGTQSLTLSGLAPNIRYEVKATTVDNYGNESVGITIPNFYVKQTPFTHLTGNIAVTQEPTGGLLMKWNTEAVTQIEFDRFKLYYGPVADEVDPKRYKETVFSNRTAKSATLRDLPTGTHFLQLRFFDSYGMEQVITDLKNFDPVRNINTGYYVQGPDAQAPTDVDRVRIQPDAGNEMLITWNAAASNGTHVEVWYAERSPTPNWQFAGKVDRNAQKFSVRGLDPNKDYFFRLLAIDDPKKTKSVGVIFDNAGYGYNLLNGDRYAPREVTEATASLSLNTLTVSYVEPRDPDLDKIKIYLQKVGSTEAPTTTDVARGSNGTVLRDLVPGQTYTLRLTTVDVFGNESTGVALTNNGQGYLIIGGNTQSYQEVRGAYMIPDTNKLTVRFLDPLASDYDQALVSIKRRTDTSYVSTQVLKRNPNGANEAVFTGLESNQQYQVRIVAVSTAQRQSTGITLGGTTGVGLLPVSDVTNARVTPGPNRLTVTWTDPANTTPTRVQVEVQEIGTNTWSDPLFVTAGSNRAVLMGLAADKSYRVRVLTRLNDVASPGLLLQPHQPRNASVAASISKIARNTTLVQPLSLLGTQTQFSSSATMSVKLYNEAGTDLSAKLSNARIVSADRIDFGLSTDLDLGRYRLVVQTPQDGELATWIEVVSATPPTTLAHLSKTTSLNGQSGATVTLTGTGFTANSKVVIDGGTPQTPTFLDSQHLTFAMPGTLLPGTHKITVLTNGTSTNPLSYHVYPFRGDLSLTTKPTMRTGTYKATLRATNLDINPRSGKIMLIIRRNGQFMESRELPYVFNGNESKDIQFEFGGNNSPYADGPTKMLSIQAHIVDSYNSTPLSDPIVLHQDINL